MKTKTESEKAGKRESGGVGQGRAALPRRAPSTPSTETRKTLRDITTEITAGMILFPMTGTDRVWNDAHRRALAIIANYERGVGLFQMAP